ncbi:MAG: fused MFS/spermidine synthase [Pseudomonadales bacterium]
MNFRRLTVYLLAFASGFAIMSIELLGGRILSPYFGSGIYVWGSIIFVFMLALSIGYLVGGQLSLRNPRLAKYGLFFLAAAVTALPIILYGDAMLDEVFARLADPRYGSLLAAGIMFIAPTAILGMIAPYSVRLLVETTYESGRVAGMLYFVSTLGSALGTLLTSFYLVLWFEINTILISLCLCLVVCFIIALAADLWLDG